MAKITGVLGLVTFATGYTTNVDTWTLTIEVDEHSVTDFSPVTAGWDSFHMGQKRWSGSYTAFVDDTAQMDANANWMGGPAAAAATFGMDAARTYSGSIWITGSTVDTSPGDMVKVTFNFRGEDLLTVN